MFQHPTSRPLYLNLLALALAFWPTEVFAQLTLRHAVEAAVHHYETMGSSKGPQAVATNGCIEIEIPHLVQLSEDSFCTNCLLSLLVRNDAPTPDFSSIPKELASSPSVLEGGGRQRSYVVLCTALRYIELETVNSQIEVVRRQEVAAARLLKIETNRVVEKIDNPTRLTRAKLRAARTRLWAAKLEQSASLLRSRLAFLTGIREEGVELIADSIPPLPNPKTTTIAETVPSLKEVIAVREVAQLEYVLAHTDRMQMTVKTVLATANLGDLVAAYINELEKFNILLETNFKLQQAELQLLYATDRVEKWVFENEPLRESTDDSATPPLVLQPANLTNTRFVMTVMITPARGTLMVGQSQQFSAIAIYSDGTAKDVTWQAIWQCSSNSGAIVSMSGLVTALTTGQVTVTATVASASQSRQIAVILEDPTLLNP